MSDTDESPLQMESINDTHSWNDSPVIVGTPSTQTGPKNRAKKKQNLHQEQESALRSAQQVHELKSVKKWK